MRHGFFKPLRVAVFRRLYYTIGYSYGRRPIAFGIRKPPDDVLIQSVYDSKNWPYAGVDEELKEKNPAGKPYGPFSEWVFNLGLNINSASDLETCHLLLCLLNYAAGHDNRIDDTRDFLGFVWWYTEKMKRLQGLSDPDKRRSAYEALVYRILDKSDYLSIDLFSPDGEIYAVSLMGKNAGISDYMAVKLELQRCYARIGEDRERDFLGVLDLREIDPEFSVSLADADIYQTYIREFFLYELTPENIQDVLSHPRFAVIKVPTKQNIVLPPEYLSQLNRVSFLKLTQVFLEADGTLRNADLLKTLLDRVNPGREKKISPEEARFLMLDRDSLETERGFWTLFLESVTGLTPNETEGAGNLLLYAFLLGAVMPEPSEAAEQSHAEQLVKSRVRKQDVVAFFSRIAEDRTADYTFATFLEILPDLPCAERYRGMEKEFLEQCLEILIRDRQVTKLREPHPVNISHFIVTRNILTMFYSRIETIRNSLLAQYARQRPASEQEFRLDIEKTVSASHPIFYQLYVRKDFAGFLARSLEQAGEDVAARYRRQLLIAGTREPEFLPLPELLGVHYEDLKTVIETVIPADGMADTTGRSAVRPSGRPVSSPGQSAAVAESGGPGKTQDAEGPRAQPANRIPAGKNSRASGGDDFETGEDGSADIFEMIVILFRKIGRAFRNLFRGVRESLVRSMEKDLDRREKIRTDAARVQAAVNRVGSQLRRKTAGSGAQKDNTRLSLEAVTKTLIEEFTGSKDLSLEEAIGALAELWNDPKTIKKEEHEAVKRENLVLVNSIIRNNTQNLSLKNVSEDQILERAAEIADFKEIETVLRKLVPKKENKEVLRRYAALRLCAALMKR